MMTRVCPPPQLFHLHADMLYISQMLLGKIPKRIGIAQQQLILASLALSTSKNYPNKISLTLTCPSVRYTRMSSVVSC